MKFQHLQVQLSHTLQKNTISVAELCLIHEMQFTVQVRPELMTWMGDQCAHFVVPKSALIPQIQTQVLSHNKKNQQIPSVLLEVERAQGKSLFQQPVMMISHNLGDRLCISQMR